MVISDSALVLVEDTRTRLLRRLGDLCRLRRPEASDHHYDSPTVPSLVCATTSLPSDIAQDASLPSVLAEAEAVPVRKQIDVQAREIVLTPEERRARAIALRGLSQSRAHRFDSARESFIEATQMDPALDLAKLPDFWRLPLGAHQAAIEAYEHVGRRRDAAGLTAAVRSTFRPRLFRPRVMPRPALPES